MGCSFSADSFLVLCAVLVVSVRGLLGGCLVLYLFSFTMALRENCCSPNFYTCCLAGRKTEVFAFLAELLGISGMLLFSVDEYESVGDFNRLSWAHALCDFGLAVSLIGSIMMACSQHSLSPVKPSTPSRLAATPLGYESLANSHRSSSLQGRSAHASHDSPFQGRTTTSRVSGPIPSPAAIAAITAAVSPKQQRVGMSSLPTSPLHRKMSSPASYPDLDPLSSPARRRKFSVQSCHFAGVHNQGKHPPVFLSQQMRDEWRMQQSATWSEDMRVEGGGGTSSTQEKLNPEQQQQQQQQSRLSQQQSRLSQQQGQTWGAAVERERSWSHNVHCDRERRTPSGTDQYGTPFRMPPPKSYSEYHNASRSRLPPSASYSEQYIAASRMPPTSSSSTMIQAAHYGSPVRESHMAHINPERKQPRLLYQHSDPGYPPPQPARQWRRASSSQQEEHHHRPNSGGFPDPPPLEELLVYEEERPTDTSSYHGYPNPIPGEMMTSPKRFTQPMVLYHNPLHSAHGGVTESVTITPLDARSSPFSRSTLPNMTSHANRHSMLHHQQKQQHQTFPRQQASYLQSSLQNYVTCE